MAKGSPPPSSPSETNPVEEAQIANILAKLQAGKVLNSSEEKRLTEYQSKQTAAGSRVADNMGAASSISGLSEKELARAKNSGCPAFRGSRVYIDELLPWWEENKESLPTGDTELDEINREIAREKLRKIKFDNAVNEGKFADMEKVLSEVQGIAETTLTEVRRIFEEEAPWLQQGKTADEIREINRGMIDTLCAKTKEKIESWTR